MDHLDDPTLNAYLDAALAPADARRVADHLAACGACRARHDALAGLFATLATLPEAPLARDLAPGVLAAIDAAEARPATEGSAGRWLRWLLLGQLLVTAGLLALLWPLAAPWLAGAVESLVAARAALAPSLGPDVAAWLSAASLALARQRQVLAGFQPALDVPTSTLITIVALAGLAWLAGNGILLRPAASVRNEQPNGGNHA